MDSPRNQQLPEVASKAIVREEVDSDGKTTILDIEVEKNIILKEDSEALIVNYSQADEKSESLSGSDN